MSEFQLENLTKNVYINACMWYCIFKEEIKRLEMLI